MSETGLPFTKVEGMGNDFVLLEWEQIPESWQGRPERLAQILCHRPFGVGADGLLIIQRKTPQRVVMRMFNPDGTEDFCGNGLRCVARFAYEHGYTDATEFVIEAYRGQEVPVRLHLREGTVDAITTTLPAPRFHPRQIPMLVEGEVVEDYPLTIADETLRLNAVNTGTTHTVIFTDRLPDDERFHKLSPRLETHPLFPERTSVLWAVVDSPETIRMRIWERGVGETLGCGSGAAAVAVLAQRAGWVSETVEVVSKGGRVKVRWQPNQPVEITGTAFVRFEGVYFLQDAQKGEAL
ncbi:MAG: diaminopimelate epimerase [Fimbriimonadales bacterium]|nr:diaminopimelate epimerase [Fimbriimonadales bacterium]